MNDYSYILVSCLSALCGGLLDPYSEGCLFVVCVCFPNSIWFGIGAINQTYRIKKEPASHYLCHSLLSRKFLLDWFKLFGFFSYMYSKLLFFEFWFYSFFFLQNISEWVYGCVATAFGRIQQQLTVGAGRHTEPDGNTERLSPPQPARAPPHQNTETLFSEKSRS